MQMKISPRREAAGLPVDGPQIRIIERNHVRRALMLQVRFIQTRHFRRPNDVNSQFEPVGFNNFFSNDSAMRRSNRAFTDLVRWRFLMIRLPLKSLLPTIGSFPAVLFVGGDDALHQRMPDDIPLGEFDNGDALDRLKARCASSRPDCLCAAGRSGFRRR